MSIELTWREAIDKVLSSSETPMHYNDIAQQIISENLRKNIGATPAATVNAQIATSIKKDGDSSPYLRVSKGTFTLRTKVSGELIKIPIISTDAEESELEDQYSLITSFGMFWRKEAVEWVPKPKLLGMQKIGATPVDFNQQFGIYLLYDGREVI